MSWGVRRYCTDGWSDPCPKFLWAGSLAAIWSSGFQRIWNGTETRSRRGWCEKRSTNVWHSVKWFQTALGLSGESRAWQCDIAFDFYPQTTMHNCIHAWQEKVLVSQFCHRMDTVPLFNNQGSICWTEPTLQQLSPPPWEMHSGEKSNTGQKKVLISQLSDRMDTVPVCPEPSFQQLSPPPRETIFITWEPPLKVTLK